MSAVETISLPPSYSDRFNDASASVSELPAYSSSPPPAPAQPSSRPEGPKEFEYYVERKGKPLAVMTVIAESTFSKHLPTYLQGTPIKGKVKLMLDKPDAIQAVIVSARGQVITGADQGEQLTFVDVSTTLWSQIMGKPRHVSFDSSESNSGPSPSPTYSPDKFIGKLQGEFIWDFSIDLPKEVAVPFGKHHERRIFNPPQTFTERHSGVSVIYQLCVRIVRNKLRADDRITTQFGYIPVIRPSPFSPMRQLAYRNGSHIIGPKMDLVGWQTLERIQIQGKIFNDRPVHIWCTLFLAKPLCYTRGSVIPFCMELESDDVQALDCLSSPKAIIVRLRRRIRYYTNGEKTLDSLEWRDSVHDSHLAVWWPSTESTDLDLKSKRILNGELRLKSDMKPTSAMGDFRVEYSVIVLAFDAPGYEPASSKLEVLREQAVEIATAYGQGPRPRMFAPPAYDTEVAPIPAAPMAFHAMSGAFFV